MSNLEHRQRWYNLLRSILKIQGIMVGVATPFYLLLYLITQQYILLLIAGVTAIYFVSTVLMLLLLAWKKQATSQLLEVTTIIEVLTHAVTVGIAISFLGTTSGTMSMYFWMPLLVTILGRQTRTIAATTALAISCIFISITLQDTGLTQPVLDLAQKLPYINGFLWGISLGQVLAGLIVFRSQLQGALSDSNNRASQLTIANQQMTRINTEVVDLSTQLRSATVELRATSRQQAAGASEQAASIVQATTSLKELGETAKSIAGNTNKVAIAANQSLSLAREVEAKSEYVNALTEHGQISVKGVIEAIEAVRSQIEGLAQHLLTLSGQSQQIGTIVGLMHEIADETHLLSLNASIESVGKPDNGFSSAAAMTTNYSENPRFAVIASEIKNLADRSLAEAQDVQRIVVEVQGSIVAAVLAAEEGKKVTVRTVNQAHTSGEVIQELGQAVEQSVKSAVQIVEAAYSVATLTDEITLATQQQGSASEQLILTMQTLEQIAREGASAITQTSATASQIDEQVVRLNGVLDEANQIISSLNDISSSSTSASQPGALEDNQLALTRG